MTAACPAACLPAQGSNDVQWHSFSNCSNNLTLALPHNGWVLANAGAAVAAGSKRMHQQLPACSLSRACLPATLARRTAIAAVILSLL